MGNRSGKSLHYSSVWALSGEGDPIALLACLESIPTEEKAAYLTWSSKPDYHTPLAMATLLGHEECVKILLNAGANPNHVGRDGMCPLHLAVKTNNVSICRLLLGTKQTDCNMLDVQGDSPLLIALALGHAQVLEELLNCHQTDMFTCQAKSKLTALQVARKAYRESKASDRTRFQTCLNLVEKVRNLAHSC